MGSFQRVNPLASGSFVRGPARLLVAALSHAFPAVLSDIVKTTTTGQASEVQTLTITGTPAGGTFTLTFQGFTTVAIAFNAAAADVVTALTALSNIGTGGVTASGGPLPGTPVVITFAAQLANQAQPLITAVSSLTGGTTPTVAVARTTAGVGQWDPASGWTEVGSTKGGVSVERSNTEELFDVDQILGPIASEATDWTLTVTTALAEVTLENLRLVWEGGTITVDTGNNERHLPLGNPQFYTHRRLAVLNRDREGLVRAHTFRDVTRAAQASAVNYDKVGPQQTLPAQFRAFSDPLVQDENARFGEVIEQTVVTV